MLCKLLLALLAQTPGTRMGTLGWGDMGASVGSELFLVSFTTTMAAEQQLLLGLASA